MKQKKEMPSISLRFPEGSKVNPQGFESVSVNEDVTVMIKARISGLKDNPDEWDRGKTINLGDIKECRVLGKEKKISISDALKAAERKK